MTTAENVAVITVSVLLILLGIVAIIWAVYLTYGRKIRSLYENSILPKTSRTHVFHYRKRTTYSAPSAPIPPLNTTNSALKRVPELPPLPSSLPSPALSKSKGSKNSRRSLRELDIHDKAIQVHTISQEIRRLQLTARQSIGANQERIKELYRKLRRLMSTESMLSVPSISQTSSDSHSKSKLDVPRTPEQLA